VLHRIFTVLGRPTVTKLSLLKTRRGDWDLYLRHMHASLLDVDDHIRPDYFFGRMRTIILIDEAQELTAK